MFKEALDQGCDFWIDRNLAIGEGVRDRLVAPRIVHLITSVLCQAMTANRPADLYPWRQDYL
jgi:hypothetical protein